MAFTPEDQPPFVSMKYGVYIDGKDMHSVLEAESDRFRGYGAGTYQPLFDQTEKWMARSTHDKTSINPFLVPAAAYVVNASLQLLQDEVVAFQLPFEVAERADVANELARAIAQSAMKTGTFSGGYRGRGELLNRHDKSDLLNKEVLGSLGATAFFDASWAAGGALKLLNEVEPELPAERAAEIIQESTGLAVFAKLKNRVLPQARRQLGSPYIYPEHLELAPERKVRAAKTMMERLRAEFGPACPIMHFMTPEGINMWQAEWKHLVGYLVPEDAAVNREVNITA
jgi:hypothetical protein